MALPYKIATLLYCSVRRRVLLLRTGAGTESASGARPAASLHRSRESPYRLRLREALEELGTEGHAERLHLTGIGQRAWLRRPGHWLMFLFEIKPGSGHCPPHREGRFEFLLAEQTARIKTAAD